MENKITMQKFRDAIKQHKSIILNYPPSGQCYPYVKMRYDMDQRGNVRQVFPYNRSVYFIGHIDSEWLKENLYNCEGVVSIEPTPQESLRKIDVTKYE